MAGIPFKNPKEALEWAAGVLDCDIEKARELFEGCEADSKGKKSRNFFNLVNDMANGIPYEPGSSSVDRILEDAELQHNGN